MTAAQIILGIESSCDDTSSAVVRREGNSRPEVLSCIVHGQSSLHAGFGGIVPEIAARAHAEKLDVCTREALGEAKVSLAQLDAIAVTAGPGLIGGLLAGVSFAKGLCVGANKPLIGVNHLAAHALTVRLVSEVDFPYLALLVSGGHCQLLGVLGVDEYWRIGGTIDDAPGEALDKSARYLGLDQPGGPALEETANSGDALRFALPRPLLGRPGCDMSFSGLKTALIRTHDGLLEAQGRISEQDVADLCAGFQAAIVDVLTARTGAAIGVFRHRFDHLPNAVAVCGGVAANTSVRRSLKKLCRRAGVRCVIPGHRLCTDNGAMIAWTGHERFRLGLFDGLDLTVRSRWPLDTRSPPLVGFGKRGAKA